MCISTYRASYGLLGDIAVVDVFVTSLRISVWRSQNRGGNSSGCEIEKERVIPPHSYADKKASNREIAQNHIRTNVVGAAD